MKTLNNTVLIVDDAPSNIHLLSGVLKAEYKVKAATSGAKALKIAAKTPCPDLILLDIVMPEMDGYEVCRQLKKNLATRDIPVIFVTGKISDPEMQQGLEVGAVAYLFKPVNPDELQAIIKRTLSRTMG